MTRSTVPDLDRIAVRDVMKTDLVTLTPDMSVRRAVELFEEYRIGGAPVIDETSRRAVGVLSAHDVVRVDHVNSEGLEAQRNRYYLESTPFDDDEPWIEPFSDMDDFSPETVGDRTVGEWMTTGVISVDPQTTLRRVCRVMRDEGIHRVFVTEEDVLLGVVTTSDIVRIVAG